MYLTTLSLTNFRSHAQFNLRDLAPGFNALIGPNGVGKTNILEAISLLCPGRGLRHADGSEVQARDSNPSTEPWSIHASIEGRYGPGSVGVGLDPLTNRRRVHVNGAPTRNQAAIGEWVQCLWLTPREDRLFMDAASARRKWLDRWVFTADPAHAGRINRLERLLTERNRLLTMPRVDGLWLDALEDDLATTAVAVSLARHDYLETLRGVIAARPDTDFPVADMALQGFMDDQLGHGPAVMAEQNYLEALRAARPHDARLGVTSIGPHRSDWVVTFRAKGMVAAQCSTGEQKALLLSLFLAQVRLVKARYSEAPIVILDEVAAHMDRGRAQSLYDQLAMTGAQVFLSATHADAVTGARGCRIIDMGPQEVAHAQPIGA